VKLNPELDFSPDKPPFLFTRNHDEYMKVLEREKKGELFVEFWDRVPPHNSHFRFKVRYE